MKVQRAAFKLQPSTNQPRYNKAYSFFPSAYDVLTGLEWAEIVLAADGDREITGLIS